MPSSTSFIPSFWPAITNRDVDLLAMHADAPAGGDQHISVVEGIIDLRQPPVGSGRGAVHVLRCSPVQGLMRTFCIEFADEGVETSLLLSIFLPAGCVASFFSVRCMRSCRRFCCGWPSVENVRWRCPASTPDGELRQIVEAVRAGEGHAVVAADCVWQTTLGKQPAKGLDDGKLLVRRKGFAGKKMA